MPEYQDKGGDVYFIVVLKKEETIWKVQKTYEDFEELQKILVTHLHECPFLPPRSFFPLGGEDLIIRQKGLDSYMKAMVRRVDAMHANEFLEFIRFPDFFPHIITQPPGLLASIDQLPMPVSKILYLPEQHLLFVGMAESNPLSVIESYITLNFFNKSVEDTGNFLGQVIAYHETPPFNAFKFSQLWRKNLIKGVHRISFFQIISLVR